MDSLLSIFNFLVKTLESIVNISVLQNDWDNGSVYKIWERKIRESLTLDQWFSVWALAQQACII